MRRLFEMNRGNRLWRIAIHMFCFLALSLFALYGNCRILSLLQPAAESFLRVVREARAMRHHVQKDFSKQFPPSLFLRSRIDTPNSEIVAGGRLEIAPKQARLYRF